MKLASMKIIKKYSNGEVPVVGERLLLIYGNLKVKDHTDSKPLESYTLAFCRCGASNLNSIVMIRTRR